MAVLSTIYTWASYTVCPSITKVSVKDPLASVIRPELPLLDMHDGRAHHPSR